MPAPEFASLLRQYRAAAALSQEELAERARLSRRGISDLERGVRRLPHPATVRRLAGALRLPQADQAALLASAGQIARPSPDVPVAPALPNPATLFIGRGRELTNITTKLADPDCRILTLLGPGGIGKTRIAVELARQYVAQSLLDVCFVVLAEVTSVDLLVSAIAGALGLSLSGARPDLEVLDYLRDRQLMLVLHNFEQLVESASAFLSIMSRTAPGVQVVVTSRERLNLEAERVFEIDGLAYPNVTSADSVEQYDAVVLFAQRAGHVQPRFVLAEHGRSVQAICQRVEGMPLALELAATWLRVLPCEQVAQNIEHGLHLLALQTVLLHRRGVVEG